MAAPYKTSVYEEYHRAARTILGPPDIRANKLKALVEYLQDTIPHYNWVGFYWVDEVRDRLLVLGPYAGAPTEHKEIPFGRGICGLSAQLDKTIVVPDVRLESNYLACSADTRSELVVPIRKAGIYIGQLDVDSHTVNAFTDDDQELLESLCELIGAHFSPWD